MFKRKHNRSGKTHPPIVLSLEGNIGSGKSTLLLELKKTCEKLFGEGCVTIMPEPVGIWQEFTQNGMSQKLKSHIKSAGEYVLLLDDDQNETKTPDQNESSKNILELYYSEQRAAFAFIMQVIANSSRISGQVDSFTTPIVLMERHSGSDGLFIRVCHENGDMTKLEAETCLYFVNALYKLLPSTPAGLIYLDTNPQTCMKRISSRNRPGEIEGISQKYLEQLSKAHEKWLDVTPLNSLKINGNIDASARDRVWEIALRNELLCFLRTNFESRLHDHFEMNPRTSLSSKTTLNIFLCGVLAVLITTALSL